MKTVSFQVINIQTNKPLPYVFECDPTALFRMMENIASSQEGYINLPHKESDKTLYFALSAFKANYYILLLKAFQEENENNS